MYSENKELSFAEVLLFCWGDMLLPSGGIPTSNNNHD